MSGWGLSWFGGSSAQAKRNEAKNTILDLRSHLDMLEKREKHLQAQADEADAKARKHLKTNPKAAREALRRKQGHLKALEQNSNTVRLVEEQINAIETANITATTFKTLKAATSTFKTIQKDVSPEELDKLKDDIDESHAKQDDINQIFTQSLSLEPEVDEEYDEMMAEENARQNQELSKQLLDTGSVPVSNQIQHVPAAPTGEINAEDEAENEDDEFAKLQEEMGMKVTA